MNEIKLGSKVKDTITDFTGIAVARTEWMNGCVRIAVKSQKLKDGKPIGEEWIDRGQLEIVEEEEKEAEESGGAQNDPSMHSMNGK